MRRMLVLAAGLCMAPCVPAAPETVPAASLAACARISGAAERLSCYDTLAGRQVTGAAAAAPAPPPATTVAPAVAAPALAAAPVPAAAVPVATTPENFGLYAAEHPNITAGLTSITLNITALGAASAAGRQLVTLEGGQIWQLEDSDGLLAVGQAVTIKRAALGSFVMITAGKRMHRVRRLG